MKRGLLPVPKPMPEVPCQGALTESKTKEGKWVVHTGISGVVVHRKDFRDWEKYVRKEIFPGIKMSCKSSGLDSTALVHAIGMIWPDQSYASLNLFRGESDDERLCEFHSTRIQALSGKYVSGLCTRI